VQICDSYLAMAVKEGNTDVAAQLETAMRVAMQAKQATLRPEIRLLNELLAIETPDARQKVRGAACNWAACLVAVRPPGRSA
jgi:hypothetical protein